ncbi:MAG: lipocalin family protein [Bacteroidota bacterium]
MNRKTVNKNVKAFLILTSLSLFVFSCNDDEGVTIDDQEEAAGPEIKETAEKLIGEWYLINSTIDGESTDSDDFSVLKESYATFRSEGTYEVVYKRITSNSFSSSTQSGTFTITGLNTVTFFNSSSEIKLIDETLQITSSTSDGQTQVDTFIRSDNEEFTEEEGEEEAIDIEDEDKEEEEVEDNGFDGSSIIEEILLGSWKIQGIANECMGKGTIEFTSETDLKLTQYKSTFNRNDLLSFNMNISFPMPAAFKATATLGDHTAVFDTEADCQFVKKSALNYTVENETTISINNRPQLQLIIEDSQTLLLKYEYIDKNSEKQTIQYTFTKE